MKSDLTGFESHVVVEHGACFNTLRVRGTDPSKFQDDVALRVMTPRHESTTINHLIVRNCGMPLKHDDGAGPLKIKIFDAREFSADLFNSSGNIDIETLLVVYDYEGFNYNDNYHVDALGQIFSTLNRVVKNVRIHNIVARIKHPKAQGFMGSEANDYIGIHIGTGKVDIQMIYPWAAVMNSARHSSFNVGKNNGIKILNVKRSPYATNNVTLGEHGMLAMHLNDSRNMSLIA